ncbi:MAG TPA: hypothetical protein PKY38_11990 [Opitutaceae bacterium]|nr:hypothetical protein [Opitutaceae bacterium]
MENRVLGHEKAPQVVLRRFPEMERAKRLELLEKLLHEHYGHSFTLENNHATAAGSIAPSSMPGKAVRAVRWLADLDHILQTWPTLDEGMRASMIAIARASMSPASVQHQGVRSTAAPMQRMTP